MQEFLENTNLNDFRNSDDLNGALYIDLLLKV
jgi:hypothetical protein